MMFLRFLNIQGIAGCIVGVALAALLTVQKIETRHWKKQSESFEQLYAAEKASLVATAANYRAAADAARAADKAANARVSEQRRVITERTANDFQARLAAARSRAEQLRFNPESEAYPSAGGNAPVSRLPQPAEGARGSAAQDGLSSADALIATEQAIQLDELIRWVRSQAAVDNNPKPATSSGSDSD